LLEQNPDQALVGIQLDGQQKQIAQKTAKITKGLGIDRAPTGCGTQLGEAQSHLLASPWVIIESMNVER
jgi:hypothetical protein